MMKSCVKWKMTKFDIFVVNLKRSVDRREAMREKIARIEGFKEIYIDGELVCKKNSSLGTPFALVENFGEQQTPSLVLSPKFSTNTKLPPQILELDSNKSNSRNSTKSSLRENERSEFSWQSKQNQNARSANLCKSFCYFWLSPKVESPLPLNHNLPNNTESAKSADSVLHFHFFPATDATNFKNGESPIPPQYSSKLTRFVKGKDLSFGEIACFSSHYRLWQKCVALDSPIIVLEDDIDFMQDFCQIIEIFKSPFEYVRLYYLFDRKITHLYDNFYISFGNISGAQGYYLTPQAAQKFIKNAIFWLFCVDDYMDMFFIHSVKNIIFKPFIISEDLYSATQSTISGREKPQMRFYQKLTRELSRIYFFAIRKYLYFALHCVELRAFFRANRR